MAGPCHWQLTGVSWDGHVPDPQLFPPRLTPSPLRRAATEAAHKFPSSFLFFWAKPRKDGGRGLLYHKLKRTLATASFCGKSNKNARRCNRYNSLEEDLKAQFKEKSSSYNSLSAHVRKTDQDSWQPPAEIPPASLMRESGTSLSTLAQYPDYVFQGRSLEG